MKGWLLSFSNSKSPKVFSYAMLWHILYLPVAHILVFCSLLRNNANQDCKSRIASLLRQLMDRWKVVFSYSLVPLVLTFLITFQIVTFISFSIITFMTVLPLIIGQPVATIFKSQTPCYVSWITKCCHYSFNVFNNFGLAFYRLLCMKRETLVMKKGNKVVV
jgi:hypothetical protein